MGSIRRLTSQDTLIVPGPPFGGRARCRDNMIDCLTPELATICAVDTYEPTPLPF
jgi:hypothetical protein